MTQYIPKDALVAELERRKKQNILTNEGAFEEDIYILYFISTLGGKGVDLEKDVRQILSLYYEGIKHYEDIIKEEREENGGSDLAIKILDGVVNARELGIQYVIDKLKAQKGEKL